MQWCDPILEKELDNWARWARGPISGSTTRTSSLEGRYRPPEDPENPEPVKSYDPIDELTAVRVEKIICGLCKLHKFILKQYYVYRADTRHTRRRLRIAHSTWETEMLSAHRKISVSFFRNSV